MTQQDTTMPLNTIAVIQRITAKRYGTSIGELNSTRRSQDIVRPRHIAMAVAKRMTGMSYPALGRRFGGRDHSSIHHAVSKVEERAKTDQELCSELEMIEHLVRDGANGRLENHLGDLATRLAPKIARRLNAQIKPKHFIERHVVERFAPCPFEDEVSAVVTAYTRLENDQFTRGEATSRQALETALKVLRIAFRNPPKPSGETHV